MLFGLGHDAVVRGDDEQGGINGAHAGEHVADEVDMPRNIHEAKQTVAVVRLISLEGEAEVDRQAPLFLLGEGVGIDPGQIAHKQGLAVIDMTRGGDRQRAPACFRSCHGSAHGVAQAPVPVGRKLRPFAGCSARSGRSSAPRSSRRRDNPPLKMPPVTMP